MQDLLTKPGDLIYLMPLFILAGSAILLILLDALKVSRSPKFFSGTSLFLVVASMLCLLLLFPYRSAEFFGGALVYDGFSATVALIVMFLLFLTLLISAEYLNRVDIQNLEYFPLLLICALGMVILPMARELISIIVSIEVLSVPLYVLSGYNRRLEASKEAGFKYFLLGAFGSAFLIYGTALIYGSTGTIWIKDLALNIPLVEEQFVLLAGLGLLFVGFSFKLGLVPFHSWVPDVYEGAPSPVVGFMAGAVKVVVLASLMRVLLLGFGLLSAYWRDVFAFLAIITMFLGNLWALHQMSLKRLLAYSSITHMGFMAIGLSAVSREVASSVIFYALVYSISVLGAFALISSWARKERDDVYLDDLLGLSQSQPFASLMLTILLLSLIGIPATAGFLAKLYLFYEVYKAGKVALVLIAIINSIISIYYYVRVISAMYLLPATEEERLASKSSSSEIPSSSINGGFSSSTGAGLGKVSFFISLTVLVCVALTLALGLVPRIVLELMYLFSIQP